MSLIVPTGHTLSPHLFLADMGIDSSYDMSIIPIRVWTTSEVYTSAKDITMELEITVRLDLPDNLIVHQLLDGVVDIPGPQAKAVLASILGSLPKKPRDSHGSEIDIEKRFQPDSGALHQPTAPAPIRSPLRANPH